MGAFRQRPYGIPYLENRENVTFPAFSTFQEGRGRARRLRRSQLRPWFRLQGVSVYGPIQVVIGCVPDSYPVASLVYAVVYG